MCGVAGKYNFNKELVSKALIKKMCNSITHRGPDDEGFYVNENAGIGMRRLSIIDLESGAQPVFNEDKSLAIVFNGEIYNYKELQIKLRSLGHRFLTNSDTEVLIHAYEEYGFDFLQKINGMFAIAILDIKKNEFFIARDRIGIKPLFYYLSDDSFIFGSEIKCILEDESVEKRLNREALDLFLSYMYVPAPYCMFENIYKLEPGHFLTVNSKGVKKTKYWDIDFKEDNDKPEEDFKLEFQKLFEDSVKKRMISEMPLGAFLSGGIDSSAIVAQMSKLSKNPVKTFSIGFKEGGYHDETKYAEQIAKKYKTDHTTFKVDSNVLELMDMFIHHFDEPFADYAAFPTYVVSKLAKEKVSVVLTGDGGDEIFGGYNRYKTELLMRRYRAIPLVIRKFIFVPLFSFFSKVLNANSRSRQFADALVKRNKQSLISFKDAYFESLQKFDFNLKNKVLKYHPITKKFPIEAMSNNWKNDVDFLSQRLYVDQKTNLPEDMLTKVDRVSMAVSLEARVPFLDHRIIELAATIPSKYKIKKYKLKHFLKESFSELLPQNILNRAKHGFSSPIDKWMREGLKTYINEKLSVENLDSIGIFNSEEVRKMLKLHLGGSKNFGEQLFMVLVCQEWAVKWAVKK
jgi:asparagine synthase (glutamine-hydrolysing)